MRMNMFNENPPKKILFLGGTCTSKWRDEIIPALDYYGVEYFNPVVEDWTPECIEIENEEKNEKCNIHLYYIDSSMQGVYSIAELVKSCYDTIAMRYDPDDDSYYKSKYVTMVLFVVNTDGFSEGQLRSLRAVASLVSDVTNYVICKNVTTRIVRIKFTIKLYFKFNLSLKVEMGHIKLQILNNYL